MAVYVCLLVVVYAYNQCLLCFSFLPDIWYEAALFLQRASESIVSVGVMCGCGICVWV